MPRPHMGHYEIMDGVCLSIRLSVSRALTLAPEWKGQAHHWQDRSSHTYSEVKRSRSKVKVTRPNNAVSASSYTDREHYSFLKIILLNVRSWSTCKARQHVCKVTSWLPILDTRELACIVEWHLQPTTLGLVPAIATRLRCEQVMRDCRPVACQNKKYVLWNAGICPIASKVGRVTLATPPLGSFIVPYVVGYLPWPIQQRKRRV